MLKRAWESPDGKYTTMQLVVPTIRTKEVLREIHNVLVLISESTRYFLKSGRDSTGSVIEKKSKTGASNVRPARQSRDRRLERKGRCNSTTSSFERIVVDITSSFPVTENGNKYIMVVSDYVSKWDEAFAILNQEATTVATKLIDNWISRFGIPMELHSRSRNGAPQDPRGE